MGIAERSTLLSFILVVLTPVIASPLLAQNEPPAVAWDADTVYVASPTGEKETDRASILAALEEVKPGGTVQFAPGTYLTGQLISVTVSKVTLLGHAHGTRLRGCDPSAFGDKDFAVAECNGFSLTGGHQVVRDLTFEYTWHALILGGQPCRADCPPETLPVDARSGGYVVERNTFRESQNGIRVVGQWQEPAVIRDNQFVNTYHAVVVNGMTAHIVDNHISVPEADRVPNTRHPGLALMIGGWEAQGAPACDRNLIAGNRIAGHPDAIAILLFPGGVCRDNVIRDNTIEMSRVRFESPSTAIHVRSTADSTVAGVPLALLNGVFGDGLIERNLIEGNRIIGAEGLAIEVLGASGNQIVDNTIIGVASRDPFPGNTLFPDAPEWGDANGSGIWISPESEENEITGNTFEDVTAYAVVLEGDHNRVKLLSASDSVRDLGAGNEVTRAEVRGWSDSLPHQAGFVTGADTLRYVEIVDGHVLGEWRTWQEAPDTWGYSLDKHYHFQRSGRLVLGADGIPVRMETTGEVDPDIPWYERFELEDGTARWATPRERGSADIVGPAYYAAVYPAHDLGVLARALLRSPTEALSLLPEGEARLEPLAEKRVGAGGRSRTVRLYAIHGLDLLPRYVWLNADGATFAEEWSILAGWETAFPELRAAVDDALSDYRRDLARELSPPDRAGPLVIRGARLFDAGTGPVRENMTIVIQEDRITAVDTAGRLHLPVGAEVIEAKGRMVLPGLWDMHGHLSSPAWNDPMFDRGGELLHLAGGVTTVRDVGSHVASLVALRTAIDAGEAIGPRILGAGFIDGPDGDPEFGIMVGTADEAREAVDRYADLGFRQVKIHAWLPRDLVGVVIARAKEHGMRVSGHIPDELSGREAVNAGFDEIQHIWWMVWAIPMSNEQALDGGSTWDDFYHVMADLTPDSEPVRDFVALLAAHGIALDATLGYFVSENIPPDFIADVVERFPAPVERRLRHKAWQPNYFPKSPLVRPVREKTVANLFELLPILHREGVPILVGSDTWPGYGMHYEMEQQVEAGIPAPEVLGLATIGAARAMGMDDELGSIEPGKLADLILVDGDPATDISDIRRVVTVIKNGRVYDPAAIYRALRIEPCCEE